MKKTKRKVIPGFYAQVFPAVDLHRMEPVGVSMGNERGRPLLLLKSVISQQILPVGINPLEAGLTLGLSPTSSVVASPHRLLDVLLKSLSVQIEKAVFCEIKGPHQYVELHFKNHPNLTTMKFRADEVLSSCLHLQSEILAPAEFIQRSRTLSVHMDSMHEVLNGKSNQFRNKQQYLI